MKPIENQTVEWKQSWRDEYLKWVCAFANSQGGVLEIGRDDTGRAVGLADPQRLLEDVPDKAKFKGVIAYSGIQRTETYPIPRPAFREAVLNAIVHKDYSTGNPIHIHIYPNEVLIYNDGRLPENWTEADLFAPHTSKPFNPDIANGFFRAGSIEAWGRGIEKISEACRLAGIPKPHYRVRPNEVMVGFKAKIAIGDAKESEGDTKDDTKSDTKADTKETLDAVMAVLRQQPSITRDEIATKLTISSATISRIIKNLVKTGKIFRVGSRRSGHWEISANISASEPGKKVTDGVTDKVTDKEMAILAIIKENPAVTLPQLAQKLSLSRKTVAQKVKLLRESGVITRQGSDRKGTWQINTGEDEKL